jgi:hypothetical protein
MRVVLVGRKGSGKGNLTWSGYLFFVVKSLGGIGEFDI